MSASWRRKKQNGDERMFEKATWLALAILFFLTLNVAIREKNYWGWFSERSAVAAFEPPIPAPTAVKLAISKTPTPTPRPTVAQTPTSIPTRERVEMAGTTVIDGGSLNLGGNLLSTQKEVAPKILLVPQFIQNRNLSCEASSARMAACYSDSRKCPSEEEIIQKLPSGPGLDPHKGFRGNIDGEKGSLEDYGVFAGPLATALEQLGFNPEVSYGGDLGMIRGSVDSDRPLVVWLTSDTRSGTPEKVKLPSGEELSLFRWEHAVVVVGYDENGVYINDPSDGTRKYYPNADFLRSWGYFNQMALRVSRR